MIARTPTCIRRLRRAALAAAAVSVAGGQEPPPAAQPVDKAGIASARKEFQSVKSSADPALQPKAALPRLAAPDFHVGATGSWLPQKQKAADKKPSNWLLEAMEKGERRDARNRERGRDEKDSDSLAPSDGTTRDDASGSTRDERAPQSKTEAEERERKSTAAALNPLTPFLGEWMTPQDYALLKPGLQSTDNGLISGGLPAAGGVAGAPDSSLIVPGLQGSGVSPVAVERATLRENPYLQSLNTAPVGPAVTPPPANPAPVFSTPAPAAAPPTAAGKPKAPDFVKPANDEKFFKQLKRF